MESKPYRYRDLVYKIGTETELVFKVAFASAANSGTTSLNIPGLPQTLIKDEGEQILGTAADLAGKQLVSFSAMANIATEVKDIKLNFYINDTLIKAHTNSKTETDRPDIVLFIKLMKA